MASLGKMIDKKSVECCGYTITKTVELQFVPNPIQDSKRLTGQLKAVFDLIATKGDEVIDLFNEDLSKALKHLTRAERVKMEKCMVELFGS